MQKYKKYCEKDAYARKFISLGCAYANISKRELSAKSGLGTAQGFHQRMETGRFSIGEYRKMAEALGAKFEAAFIFPDGKRITS